MAQSSRPNTNYLKFIDLNKGLHSFSCGSFMINITLWWETFFTRCIFKRPQSVRYVGKYSHTYQRWPRPYAPHCPHEWHPKWCPKPGPHLPYKHRTNESTTTSTLKNFLNTNKVKTCSASFSVPCMSMKFLKMNTDNVRRYGIQRLLC